MDISSPLSRRRFVQHLGCGGAGLSLAGLLALRSPVHAAETPGFGRAKRCMILYCWGGMSHHETWDLKPDAPVEYRGEFNPIATAVPGIHLGEHLPRLARHT